MLTASRFALAVCIAYSGLAISNLKAQSFSDAERRAVVARRLEPSLDDARRLAIARTCVLISLFDAQVVYRGIGGTAVRINIEMGQPINLEKAISAAYEEGVRVATPERCAFIHARPDVSSEYKMWVQSRIGR